MAQQAAAHAAGAFVEQREQRRRRLAAQRLGELQVAARRRVQPQVFAGALGGDRGDVREGLALGLRRVVEQRAAGADGERHVLAAEAGERAGAELLQQALPAGFDVEVPVRQPGDEETVELFTSDEDFGRADAPQLVLKRLRRYFRYAQRSARQ